MKKSKKVLQKVLWRSMGLLLAVSLVMGLPVLPLRVQAAEEKMTDNYSLPEQCVMGTENLKVEELKAESFAEVESFSDRSTNARTMMVDCYISISFSEEGMYLECTTATVGIASVLGVKDIKIMKKVWYGWKTVAVCSGAEYYDNMHMGVSTLYANAEKDETYRVTCVHYADVNGYIESENDTGAFVFTY